MSKKLNHKKGLFLLVFLPILILLMWYFSIGDFLVRYNLKYIPGQDYNKAILANPDKGKDIVINHNYMMKHANIENGFMVGHILKVWKGDSTNVYGLGSGNSWSSIPFPAWESNKTIVYESEYIDTSYNTVPLISMQNFSLRRSTSSNGRKMSFNMDIDGVYKVLDSPQCVRDNEDALIPIIAYVSPKEIKDYTLYLAYKSNWKNKSNELSMQEFIDQFLGPNEGFVIYYRARKFEDFFENF